MGLEESNKHNRSIVDKSILLIEKKLHVVSSEEYGQILRILLLIVLLSSKHGIGISTRNLLRISGLSSGQLDSFDKATFSVQTHVVLVFLHRL